MQVEGKLCDEIKPSASVAKELKKSDTSRSREKGKSFVNYIVSTSDEPLFFNCFCFAFFFSLLAHLNSVSYWSLTSSLM